MLSDPEAVTLKLVPSGAVTVWFDGWDVILGVIQILLIVNVAALLVAVEKEQELVT